MAVIIVEPGETPVYGTPDADSITGTSGAEAIYGRGGNDTIIGDGGEDTLYGGAGDDLIVLHGLAKALVVDGGRGFDVLSVGDFTRFHLADVSSIERVELTGSYQREAAQVWMSEDQALRNDGANRFEIASVDADNVLVIGTVDGVMNASKLVLENWGDDDRLQLWGSEAGDLIRGSAYNDEFVDFGGDDTFLGGGGDDGLGGGAGADSLMGQRGDDWLVGGADSDTLVGGRGSDTLAGGEGTDVFMFGGGFARGEIDTIKDFVSADDQIALEAAAFKGLAPGALAEGAFRIGSVALDADDRILYDQASGALLFDRDGSGTRFQATQIALLEGSPDLTALDFDVI